MNRDPLPSPARRAASLSLALVAAGGMLWTRPGEARAACPALLAHSFPRLQDEQSQDLCDFAGKVLLVVNTASYCGFTTQYEGLERLYAKYASRGLVVLGFPSNDFGQQEPGNSQQIGELCFNTYGVRFPMFVKTQVSGAGANPLYAELARLTGERPRWNFHKYLIDRQGRPTGSYGSIITPESRTLVNAIERALAQS